MSYLAIACGAIVGGFVYTAFLRSWSFSNYLIKSSIISVLGFVGAVAILAIIKASNFSEIMEAKASTTGTTTEAVRVEEEVEPPTAVPTLKYDFGEAAGFGNQEIPVGKFGGEK